MCVYNCNSTKSTRPAGGSGRPGFSGCLSAQGTGTWMNCWLATTLLPLTTRGILLLCLGLAHLWMPRRVIVPSSIPDETFSSFLVWLTSSSHCVLTRSARVWMYCCPVSVCVTHCVLPRNELLFDFWLRVDNRVIRYLLLSSASKPPWIQVILILVFL